jgi:Co/Zn/Cd efflux system component
LAYFGIEFAVALMIGSVSLFADSVDFLEDASINFLHPLDEQDQAGQQQRSV